jgi:hypothetical protein
VQISWAPNDDEEDDDEWEERIEGRKFSLLGPIRVAPALGMRGSWVMSAATAVVVAIKEFVRTGKSANPPLFPFNIFGNVVFPHRIAMATLFTAARFLPNYR